LHLKELADARLAAAYKEMEKLRRARQATAEKVQAIMRQRDMYKSLLAQQPNISAGDGSTESTNSIPDTASPLKVRS